MSEYVTDLFHSRRACVLAYFVVSHLCVYCGTRVVLLFFSCERAVRFLVHYVNANEPNPTKNGGRSFWRKHVAVQVLFHSIKDFALCFGLYS